MQQPQRGLKKTHQVFASPPRFGPSLRSQSRLNQLEIPVAEFSPEEIVDTIRCLIKTISLERLVHILRGAIEARKNPAVLERMSFETSNAHAGRTLLSATGPQARLNPVHIHEHEPRRIPDL